MDVFISYARADQEIAAYLDRELVAAGLTVWRDLGPGATPGTAKGAGWWRPLDDAFRAAKVVLVVWSRASMAPSRRWVLAEANLAFETGRLVQVVVDPERPSPPTGFERLPFTKAVFPGYPSARNIAEQDLAVQAVAGVVTLVKDRLKVDFKAQRPDLDLMPEQRASLPTLTFIKPGTPVAGKRSPAVERAISAGADRRKRAFDAACAEFEALPDGPEKVAFRKFLDVKTQWAGLSALLAVNEARNEPDGWGRFGAVALPYAVYQGFIALNKSNLARGDIDAMLAPLGAEDLERERRPAPAMARVAASVPGGVLRLGAAAIAIAALAPFVPAFWGKVNTVLNSHPIDSTSVADGSAKVAEDSGAIVAESVAPAAAAASIGTVAPSGPLPLGAAAPAKADTAVDWASRKAFPDANRPAEDNPWKERRAFPAAARPDAAPNPWKERKAFPDAVRPVSEPAAPEVTVAAVAPEAAPVAVAPAPKAVPVAPPVVDAPAVKPAATPPAAVPKPEITVAAPKLETPSASVSAKVTPSCGDAGGTYTVGKGDTLWSIAGLCYGDSEFYRQLIDYNNEYLNSSARLNYGASVGDPNRIYPGESIKLPPRE